MNDEAEGLLLPYTGINLQDYGAAPEGIPENVLRAPLKVHRLPNFPPNVTLRRATPGSSGVDVYAAIKQPVKLSVIGSRATIPTGIRVEVPMGAELQVRPRSGLASKYGVTVLNAPGTIDSDYRGEVGVIMVLLGSGKFIIEPGMAIAQLVMQEVIFPEIQITDELGETERGAGGFGSTGK